MGAGKQIPMAKSQPPMNSNSNGLEGEAPAEPHLQV